MGVRIEGDALVLIGAAVILGKCLEYGFDTIRTLSDGRYLVAVGYLICAFGSFVTARAVWRAA